MSINLSSKNLVSLYFIHKLSNIEIGSAIGQTLSEFKKSANNLIEDSSNQEETRKNLKE
ncbi:hypothetical protein TMU01_14380 [Tenuibacillus multivorans]|nr:hypothetical protein TMU01_14380 [Tenuibacillus multivorans]